MYSRTQTGPLRKSSGQPPVGQQRTNSRTLRTHRPTGHGPNCGTTMQGRELLLKSPDIDESNAPPHPMQGRHVRCSEVPTSPPLDKQKLLGLPKVQHILYGVTSPDPPTDQSSEEQVRFVAEGSKWSPATFPSPPSPFGTWRSQRPPCTLNPKPKPQTRNPILEALNPETP